MSVQQSPIVLTVLRVQLYFSIIFVYLYISFLPAGVEAIL